MPTPRPGLIRGIQPELWVDQAGEAVAFYRAAFGATVLHQAGTENDIVAATSERSGRRSAPGRRPDRRTAHPARAVTPVTRRDGSPATS